MSTVIDTLVLELGLDGTKFKSDAGSAKKQVQELKSGFGGASESFKAAKGAAAAFFTVVAAAAGLDKLVDKVTELNVKLGTTSKNLGMTTTALKEWQNVAELAGGSAEGMTSTMKSLSMAQTEMSVTGQSGMLPYMRALGVSMFDARGKARPLNDMLLDLSDRFSSMDRVQANNFGQMMGIDQDTMNVLMQGRGAMADMIELQKSLHKSTEEEVQASKELAQARKLLNMQLESLGTIIVNAITPIITKMVKVVTGFVDFLNKHEKFTKGFFLAIAGAITMFLLPALWSAAAAVFALIAPFVLAAVPVLVLAAAFGLLYDDYQTWAEGGKSLFDWTEFQGFIDGSGEAVGRTNKAFLKLIGGYEDWSEVGRAAFDWLKFKGFIDENGVSVNSLRTGFVNLAKDIVEKVKPILEWTLGVWNKLSTGDLSGAWDDIKKGGSAATQAVGEFFQNGYDKVTQFGRDVMNPEFGKGGNTTTSDSGSGGSSYTSTGGNTTTAGVKGMNALGSLSAKYEGKVGSANRDNIGYAYGKYQFNEATGGLQAFMRAAPEYAAKFRGLTAGTSAFAEKWKEIAKQDPKGFEAAQDKAAAAKWYSPAASHASKMGFKMGDRGLQEAVFSGSIQHGGVNKLINATAKTAGFASMSPEQQIQAYYAARSQYVRTNLSSKDPNRERTISSQMKRYANEQKDAIALSRSSGSNSIVSSANSSMFQASNAGRSNNLLASNSNKTVNVNVGEVKIHTTANTIADNVGSAYAGIRNRVTQLETGLV